MPRALISTLIGQTVTYYRCKPATETTEKTFIDGRGVAIAVFLNPDLRPMVQVKDGADVFNIDAAMINSTELARDKYRAMTDMVDKLQTEFNEKQADLVADYNNLIEAAYTSGIGEPVKLTEKTPLDCVTETNGNA